MSPSNKNQYNFEQIQKGIQQAIDRGQGERVIGVLVVDRQAWNNVANDPRLGPLLREEYNRLMEKDSHGERNYLKLEDNLGEEAQRGAYGLRDAVIKAEAASQANSKQKINSIYDRNRQLYLDTSSQ